MPWIGLSILLVLILILGAFIAYFFFGVGKDEDGAEDPRRRCDRNRSRRY